MRGPRCDHLGPNGHPGDTGAVKRRMLVLLLAGAQLMVAPVDPHAAPIPAGVRATAPKAADLFQYPLPTWSPHCLGFGSEWRYCNGAALRACASGAVWLHTETDIGASAAQRVAAAADAQISGHVLCAAFRGRALVRHATTEGRVHTQERAVGLPRARRGGK